MSDVPPDFAERLPSLIATLKGSIAMELRPSPDADRFLEGVLRREHLEQCVELLNGAFGSPAKPFDEATRFERGIQRVVDQLGGIRRDQCLFLKSVTPEQFAYAALWPWASDPQRVTLKVGMVERA